MPLTDREVIASGVRAELARQSIQQIEVARWLDVSKAAASLRLRGERAFRAEELSIIARELNVSVSRFYGEQAAA